LELGSFRPKGSRSSDRWTGTGRKRLISVEGWSLETPREESRRCRKGAWKYRKVRKQDRKMEAGPHELESVFAGEAKDTRGMLEVFTTERHAGGRNLEGQRVSARQGQGGPARKANDSHLPPVAVKPRCSFGNSGDDTGVPEVPVNSREAVGSLRGDG